MEVFKKLNYDIQELVLEKIFKESVKKNKEDLLEDFKEESWIIFDKAWNKCECLRNLQHNFCICLNVFPSEVLLHKPLNCKMFEFNLKIDNKYIASLFNFEPDDEEDFIYILYGSDKDFTYRDLVEILDTEVNSFITFIKAEYDEDIQINHYKFLEILELKKIENISNINTYKVEFFMGS